MSQFSQQSQTAAFAVSKQISCTQKKEESLAYTVRHSFDFFCFCSQRMADENVAFILCFRSIKGLQRKTIFKSCHIILIEKKNK